MALTTFAGAAAYPGGTVRVRLDGLNDLAVIYADALETLKANPFVTDPVTGAYTFWADDGVGYDIEDIDPDGSEVD